MRGGEEFLCGEGYPADEEFVRQVKKCLKYHYRATLTHYETVKLRCTAIAQLPNLQEDTRPRSCEALLSSC